MRRIIIIIVVLVVLGGAAYLFLNSQAGSRPGGAGGSGTAGGPGGAQSAIRKVTVDKGDLKLTVSATGNIVAKEQANLSFDQSGRVAEVLVVEGQQVDAGQLLARQDDSTQKANLAQAEFNLKAADASLQKLLRPVDAGDIAKAQANLTSAQGAYSSQSSSVSPSTIKAAQLQYQQAQTAADYAEKLRRDSGGQYGNDDPNYQKSVAALGQAQVNAEIARLKLEQTQRGSSLTKATANITYQQTLLAQVKAGPNQHDIDTAQANFVIAKVQRDQAQHDLDRTHLTAPFAGVVSNLTVKTGQVSSGTALLLTNTSDVYADINVDEADIGKMRGGEPVEISLDALPGTKLTGKVLRVAQTADTTASVITYAVRVVLDSNQAPLKVGMTANASFLVKNLQGVLRVPNEYLKLNRATNQTTVNLLNPDGSVTTVPVTLGLEGTDYTEIIGGLNEGETIALITASTVPGQAGQ